MDEQLEALNMIAMKIIMDAGDARDFIAKALAAMGENEFAAAEAQLEQAQERIKSAHGRQTEIIQREIAGEAYPPSLLFGHAQDTLMTIGSELNLARRFQTILGGINARFEALEGRL